MFVLCSVLCQYHWKPGNARSRIGLCDHLSRRTQTRSTLFLLFSGFIQSVVIIGFDLNPFKNRANRPFTFLKTGVGDYFPDISLLRESFSGYSTRGSRVSQTHSVTPSAESTADCCTQHFLKNKNKN